MTDAMRLLRSQQALFPEGEDLLGLDEYQQFTTLTDQNDQPGIDGLGFVLLGLFGETGSLLSELKKKQRDKDSYIAYRDSVIEELGDVLWYFSNGALRAKLPLATIAARVTANLADWDYHGRQGASTFVDLQTTRGIFSGPLSTDVVERRLFSLAGKVGSVLDNFSNQKYATNRDALSADLVEVFRLLVTTADDADVSLDEAARANISKTLSRWPVKRDWSTQYDENFDKDEQLPRRIEMHFKEKDISGKKYVIQQCNGINIGDRLTDNRLEPDDYRFHDVFHLAYAAMLGWSPVIRALFKVKRKSSPEIDENQDGARAILIEEGVATWVFNHGLRNQHFRNLDSLDYSLLKAVQELVKGYEVESSPLWQWELAILEGFKVFRQLCEKRGGTVIADLDAHVISFESAG